MPLSKVGRVRRSNGSSHLVLGPTKGKSQEQIDKAIETAARKKAATALWAWALKPKAKKPADDGDDVPELLLCKGWSESHHNVDYLEPVWPDTCLGLMCPKKSDDCDRCEVAEKAGALLDDEDEEVQLLDVHEDCSPLVGVAVRFVSTTAWKFVRRSYGWDFYPATMTFRSNLMTQTDLKLVPKVAAESAKQPILVPRERLAETIENFVEFGTSRYSLGDMIAPQSRGKRFASRSSVRF